jgi:hypothetical protein
MNAHITRGTKAAGLLAPVTALLLVLLAVATSAAHAVPLGDVEPSEPAGALQGDLDPREPGEPLPAPQPTPAPAPAPPTGELCPDPDAQRNDLPALVGRQRDWPLTGGLHMDSTIRVSRNVGLVNAEPTHIYNSYWGMGYHGDVMVILKNRCGDVIGVTRPESFGVEAKAWFWNKNQRHEYWQQSIDTAITKRTRSIQILHSRGGTGDLLTRYRQLRTTACKAWEYYMAGQKCPLPEL